MDDRLWNFSKQKGYTTILTSAPQRKTRYFSPSDRETTWMVCEIDEDALK
jgi:hypothetical protein